MSSKNCSCQANCDFCTFKKTVISVLDRLYSRTYNNIIPSWREYADKLIDAFWEGHRQELTPLSSFGKQTLTIRAEQCAKIVDISLYGITTAVSNAGYTLVPKQTPQKKQRKKHNCQYCPDEVDCYHTPPKPKLKKKPTKKPKREKQNQFAVPFYTINPLGGGRR